MGPPLVLLKPSAVVKAVEKSNPTGMKLAVSTSVFENFRGCPRAGRHAGEGKFEVLPFDGDALVARECWLQFRPLLGKMITRAYVEQIGGFKLLDADGLGAEFGQGNVAGILDGMKRNKPEIIANGPVPGREFRYVVRKKGNFYEVHEMTAYPLIANVFVEKDAGTQRGSLVFSFSYLMAGMIREPQRLLNRKYGREALKTAVDATGAELRYEMWDYDSCARPHAVVAYLPAQWPTP